jgi:tetratricopeptide (TPR) repeat protein
VKQLGLGRAAFTWLLVRALLALAAVVAAVAQAGPLVGLALAVVLAFVRPLRRGWIAVIPIVAMAIVSPLAALLLVARAVVSEGFIQIAGTDSGPEADRTPRGRRRRGLTRILAARLSLVARSGLPAVATVGAGREQLAAAKAGPGDIEAAAFALAGAAWANARPWTLMRLLPEIVLTVFGAALDSDGEPSSLGMLMLGQGLLIEMFAPQLITAITVLTATAVGALVFPAEPLSLGPLTVPGSAAQALAVLLLSLGAASRSYSGIFFGGVIAALLVRSHIWETVAIALTAGVIVTAANRSMQRFLITGGRLRSPREPFHGPWRLRGHWNAAVQAANQGRLPIAITILEELVSSPACTKELRARARARLALHLYEVGRLERAESTLDLATAEVGLQPEALPAAGAVAAGLGDLDSAERLLWEALTSLPGRSTLRHRTALTLADVCSRRGRTDEAIAVIDSQWNDSFRYGGMAPLLESKTSIAAALVRKGEAGAAQRQLDEVIGISAADGPQPDGVSSDLQEELVRIEGRARLIAGELALGQGKFDAAEKHLTATLSRLRQKREPHLFACAMTLHGVARTFAFPLASSEALEEVNKGVRLLEARRTQLRRGDHRTGLILAEANLYDWCFKAFDRAHRKGVTEAAASAAWLIESLRKSALAQMLRSADLELPAAAAELVERVGELEHEAADPARGGTTESAASDEIAAIRSDLAGALSEGFAAAYVPTPTPIEDLQQIAGRCGDVLSFYLPNGELPGWRVWARRDGSFDVTSVEVTDADAVALIAQLSGREGGSPAAIYAPLGSSASAAWERLAEALLPAELVTELQSATADSPIPPLLISPDGILGLVPWSALLLGAVPLGALAAIQVIPSLGVIGAEEAGSAPTGAAPSAVAYLAPGLDKGESERRLLDRSFELTLATSRDDFLARLRQRGLDGAYLAAHGSGLGLGQSVDFGAEPLSAGSALQAPWPPWTVFASCLVGRLDMQAGQEPLGMPISCILAGSRSVLAAMVEIPSPTLPDLVEPLVAALAEGEHPARALARAQRHYLAANPQASAAECLAFVCLTRAPEQDQDDQARLVSWQEVAKAAWALAKTEPARARATFERGIEANPDPSLVVRFADFLAREGDDITEAKAVLERGIASHPNHVELRELNAWYLARHGGDDERARAALELLLELDPDNEWGVADYARFLRVNTDEHELAIDYYRRALEIDPGRAASASGLGEVLERSGDLAGAREMYERALAQDPSRPGASWRLAMLLGRTGGEVAQIGRLYERVIRLGPERASARYNDWGLTAARDLGDRELGREILERGHTLDPADPYIAINLAWLLLEIGEDGRASVLVGLALDSTDEQSIRLEGWFYRATLGDPILAAEARHEVDALLEQGARSPGWDFSGILARVERERAGELGWARETAAAISAGSPAGGDELSPQGS